MKKCAKCKETEEHDELLVCRKCKSAFYDQRDQMFVVIIQLLAVAAMYSFKDYIVPGFTYLCGILSALILFPVFKLYQKYKYPEREVLKEVAYSLPYSFLGLIVTVVSITAITAIPSGQFVSDGLPDGDEFGLEYARYVEMACYISAGAYVAFLMVFHRGRIYSNDRFYSRIMAAEYTQITDYNLFAKVSSDKCTWYVGRQSFVVDKESFVFFADTSGYAYFKDRNGVYFLENSHTERAGMILSGCDTESFALLKKYNPTSSRMFAKDKRRVYFLHGPRSVALSDVDVEAVRVLQHDYLTDGKVIYQGADRIELDLDIATLDVLPHNYVRDRNGVYLISGVNQMKLDVADPESFEPIDYKTFKDKSGVYQVEHSQVRRMEPDELLSYVDSCV